MKLYSLIAIPFFVVGISIILYAVSLNNGSTVGIASIGGATTIPIGLALLTKRQFSRDIKFK